MAKPIEREVIVEKHLLDEAERIIDNFPKATGNFQQDIEQLRANNKILEELLYQRNSFSNSEDIDVSQYMIGETFLIVKLNPRVEVALDKLIKLQSQYFDEIFKSE